MNQLVPINILSIYNNGPLPTGMAWLTPDAAEGLAAVAADLQARGCCFRLSDAYRSSADQARAHSDYLNGRKKAYSPPAGYSMHEAGRAIDIDLASLIAPSKVPAGFKVIEENQLRQVLMVHGWVPISEAGNPHTVDIKESWHFEFRGPFQAVYDAELARSGDHKRAYTAMAKAAIAALDRVKSPVWKLGDRGQFVRDLQRQLVALHLLEPSKIDGEFGPVTEKAVMTFQRTHGLTADGKVGPGTRAALAEKSGI